MEKNFKDFKLLHFITIIILVGMVASAIIIISNVNKEFKIREVAGQLQKYKYATLSFNNVYNSLPGDTDKASFYWKDKTKDGNNNRKITHKDSEGILAWQHLQLADLIKSDFTFKGVWQDGNEGKIIANFNAPFEAIHNAVFYFDNNENDNFNFIGVADIEEGKIDSPPSKPVFTPEEAMRLDLMIDDGYPDSGNIRAKNSDFSKCNISGEYKDEKELPECIIEFRI
ncbi:MAG: hypothetical protein SFT90_04600 [Rickettsiales bacterium]|nr:hypothetical protein [Rickettsiales bacterium]